jgi:hypothetical protein
LSRKQIREHIEKGTSSLTTRVDGLVKVVPIVIGLGAALISIFAYRLSEHALKVGQRAYVGIEDSHVEVGPVARVTGVVDLRIITFTATLNNAGNTPARFTLGTASITAPNGWSIIKQDCDQQKPGYLGPRTQRYVVPARLTPEAANA